jgi:hypothetical protein
VTFYHLDVTSATGLNPASPPVVTMPARRKEVAHVASRHAHEPEGTEGGASTTCDRTRFATGSIPRYWLNTKDPDFGPKAERIVDLYLNPPPGATPS